ncbi:TetR/AcrR family transcriptional regulator [Saccharopolyspora rhizosphaerae]|uniref:TetR/AcrR family transcriptional regulator n=1 Tax=Saccharopolyspora rhizosphaerae TaxID=2492662 RepID=A0A426JI78_9PSEU|nr:TetR/AcrR family transcriptional regulator [Saccharopolyspora rhizosphaerae]RRO12843.1 TetR/AcrR family transcriptional regulator [Saccharopolyspora rhizosphaerae]
MPAEPRSPRERFREQTRNEAKQVAVEQLAESGPAGISVNAIAKRMGVTGPALYRYFANRDALLTELVVDGYRDLAETVERIAHEHRRKSPENRFREVAAGFRAWALGGPQRFLLLFGTPVPGYTAPEGTTELADRAFRPILDAFAEIAPATAPSGALDRQLVGWRERRGGPQAPVLALRRAVRAWSRLHGAISLEVIGQFAEMDVDPELLFRAEVESILAESWE